MRRIGWIAAAGVLALALDVVATGLPGPGMLQVLSSTGTAFPVNPPLVVHGERFRFNLGYLGVVGGRGTVTVEKGPDRFTLTGDVENTALLRFIFRVKDRFQTVVDLAGYTLQTRLWQDETGTKRYREEAYFSDRVVTVERSAKGERTRNVSTGFRPLDPLAALFWLRGQRLMNGDVARSPIFANNRVFDADVRVDGRELVEVMGRSWPAIRLVVSFSREGKLVDEASATVWVSDDEERIPLKGAAHTTYGKLTATLSGY